MKRLTAVLFLSIFFIQAFGYFFTYRLIKWHIHKEITTQITQGHYNSSSISSITLNAIQNTSLIWEEENEFCYQGDWYDVIEAKQNGGFTTYYCIKDNQETKLIASFTSTSKDQNSSDHNFSYTLKKLGDNYYTSFPFYTEPTFVEHNIFSTTLLSPVMQVPLSIQSPPPEA